MSFTDKDREILTETRVRVENIEGWVSNLPCQQHPPECTQEQRIKNIEKINKWIMGIMATLLGGGGLALLSLFLTYIAK